VGESGNDILRHPGDSPDAAVSVEYRRHHGSVVPLPVLEGVLLRVHQEAEEGAVQAGTQYARLGATARVSRRLCVGPMCSPAELWRA
jgi:hypothetical protein